ncbi:MotE family protein [Helicobacter sp. MIT 14-3879]|uniref:MotE family protein n=1 Tax=Helicobacter sp. MIT 14-3879 TaxID=2040649 RepID=UPI000E1EBA39|nr:PDP protein [Helicobacter sp. MIT 14-3879]RDU61710.1 PDP protein [Helicobacter sp. MIT 14-3879]
MLKKTILNKIITLLFISNMAFGDVITCNEIFEERKAEITNELNKINEQKKLMSLFYGEQKKLNDKKLEELKLQEQKIESLLKEAKDRENNIKDLIKQNEDLLAMIENKKTQKISQTYSKMKDSKAGAIIDNMPLNEAAELLFPMDSKDIGKILAKMPPQKAAKLTEILKKGPPFEEIE